RWSTYRDEPFAPFVDRVQRDLFDHRHLVPRRMRLIIDTMIEQGWLASYATPSGIRARLDTMSKRLSRRLSRPMSLVISAEQLESHLPDLADDFAELWPDLIDCVDRSRVGSIDRLAS
ncbi:MAG: acyl carrier protein phosphodiesterase, partial [Phycisphaeraceae bacterium]